MIARELYQAALEMWGLEAQLGMLQEECAEVVVAVNKYRRGCPSVDLADSLAQELADVEIMVEQMRAAGFALPIDQHKRAKLERLQKRVDAELHLRGGGA